MFVITNNHFEGKAVANAVMLKSQIQGQPVTAPATLFDAYGEFLEGFATPG